MDTATADEPAPPAKPLGTKSYGRICHLPGSRVGPADRTLNPGQTRILTTQARDRHDVVFVQEKLDGSNVCVARVGGQLVALGRSGQPAEASPQEQHRLFANWVSRHESRFRFLREGERLCGEWLALAHGTRYALPHDPFVAFDLMRGHERATYEEFFDRAALNGHAVPRLLSAGPPVSVDEALRLLEGEPKTRNGFHGAIDSTEGAVWRVERHSRVEFLAKYVRPGKVDGRYLPDVTGGEPVWNWRG